MKSFSTTLAAVLICTLCFVSCSKEKDPVRLPDTETPDPDASLPYVGRLKQEVSTVNGLKTYVDYSYRTDTLLEKIKSQSAAESALNYRIDFVGDRGKLWEASFYSFDPARNLQELDSMTKYIYTEGRLSQKVVSLPRQPDYPGYAIVFEYNQNGHIKSARKLIEYMGGGTQQTLWDFDTDMSGNVIQLTEQVINYGSTVSRTFYEISYDDHVNPKYLLADPVVFYEFFSPNNVTGVRASNSAGISQTRDTYRYDDFKRPAVRTHTSDKDDNRVLEYYYW